MSDAPYAGLEVRERRRSWRRWQMEAFDHPEQADDESLPAEPSADELAAERAAELDAARRAGFEAGRQAGHAQGLEQGRATGLAEGRETGREQGLAEGLADGRDEAARQAQRLAALADACADSLVKIEAQVGQALLSLALDVARQVVRDALAVEPERVLAAVREVVHFDVRGAAPLRLWVHSQDHEIVARHLADDLKAGGWKLLVDDSLTPGGCRAETAYGSIDATLQTRWRRVAASLGKADEWDDGAAAPDGHGGHDGHGAHDSHAGQDDHDDGPAGPERAR